MGGRVGVAAVVALWEPKRKAAVSPGLGSTTKCNSLPANTFVDLIINGTYDSVA